MQRRHIVWIIAAAALLVVGIIVAQSLSMRGSKPPGLDPQYWTRLPTSGTSIGNADAPVLVEEYFDYQCPHCHTAAETIVAPIIAGHVSRGDVRFAYRMYPILGAESIMAARGAYCAAQADAFWPYHERLISRRGTGNSGAYATARLVQDAVAAGLDESAFSQCLAGDESFDFVAEWYANAQRLGLMGTPTFIVDGTVVPTSTYAAVEREIERAIKRAIERALEQSDARTQQESP